MISDGFPHESIMTLVDNLNSVNIIKTNSRSVLGSINDHFNCLPAYLDLNHANFLLSEGIFNLKELNHKLNRVPMLCSTKGFYPIDKMKEILIEGYDSKKDKSKRIDW